MKITIKTITIASTILAASFVPSFTMASEELTINGQTKSDAMSKVRDVCVDYAEDVRMIAEYRIADEPIYVTQDAVESANSPFEGLLLDHVDVAYSETTRGELWLEGSGEIASDYFKACVGKLEELVDTAFEEESQNNR